MRAIKKVVFLAEELDSLCCTCNTHTFMCSCVTEQIIVFSSFEFIHEIKALSPLLPLCCVTSHACFVTNTNDVYPGSRCPGPTGTARGRLGLIGADWG